MTTWIAALEARRRAAAEPHPLAQAPAASVAPAATATPAPVIDTAALDAQIAALVKEQVDRILHTAGNPAANVPLQSGTHTEGTAAGVPEAA